MNPIHIDNAVASKSMRGPVREQRLGPTLARSGSFVQLDLINEAPIVIIIPASPGVFLFNSSHLQITRSSPVDGFEWDPILTQHLIFRQALGEVGSQLDVGFLISGNPGQATWTWTARVYDTNRITQLEVFNWRVVSPNNPGESVVLQGPADVLALDDADLSFTQELGHNLGVPITITLQTARHKQKYDGAARTDRVTGVSAITR